MYIDNLNSPGDLFFSTTTQALATRLELSQLLMHRVKQLPPWGEIQQYHIENVFVILLIMVNSG